MFRILMNYHLGNDFLEDYNWSNDFRHNDSFNDLSDQSNPYPPPLSIDLASFANKFPLHNKPEVTTGEGLEIFGVLFDSHKELPEENDILDPPPPIQEKKADSVAPSPSVSERRAH